MTLTDFDHFREENEVCPFPCLLSNFGGTVGIFFGISFLQVIYAIEWVFSRIIDRVQGPNKLALNII